MRFKLLFSILAMAPILSHAATVVNFGAALCDAGRVMSAGECITLTRGVCDAGYYQVPIDGGTFSAALRETNSCMNSYNVAVLSEYLRPIYDGIIVEFGATLCGANQVLSSGECVTRTQGRCRDGYYQALVNGGTFSSMSAETNECTNSYNQYELPDLFELIYNGVLVDFGAVLCGAGEYLSSGVCMPRSRGDCPDNFWSVDADDATLTPRVDSECATGYNAFWLNANCASGQAQHNMCATLCDAGLSYTGAGGCALACSVNPGRNVMLRSESGLSLQLYPTRLTTPALGVLTSTGQVCYGNLMPGVQSGTINVTVSGQDYHLTD